jgi:alkylation response protein AidB-like acyl-CoA dehydrogenase
MSLTVDRELPTDEAHDLLELVRDLVDRELLPRVDADERDKRFPRDVYDLLAKTGLMGLAYPVEHGGGGQAYETYLQVLEEISAGWISVGIGVSVHTLATFPVAEYGSAAQQAEFLPDLLEGRQLGAYCLSEPSSGSDAAALTTRAVLDGDDYVVTGTKAWITHAGVADVYSLMVRTSDEGPKGITCLFADASTAGLSTAAPERKMAAGSSPTAQVILDGAHIPSVRRIGEEGQGFSIALAALDSGRLGIAACAVGLAQAALDAAVAYAKERRQFGRPIADFQGLQFMLADMATQIVAARELYLAAARRRDRGQPFGQQAAMAKLFATDMAMRVTTDAVQVLGGYGYVEDFPLERYMREAKVLQIVEGTNQIQRVVIARGLLR